jgi:hypothetical protein
LLYLIGGPARSGKSELAARLLRERRVPYFPLDYLTSGLVAVPGLRLDHDLPPRERGERLWPVLHPLLRNIAEVEPVYLVEGDALLPDHMADLIAASAGTVRGCFLGYAHIAIEQKLTEIRAHPGMVNDWAAGLSDEELAGLVKEMKEFSRFLESECARLRLPYLDGSFDFHGALHRAEYQLLGPMP